MKKLLIVLAFSLILTGTAIPAADAKTNVHVSIGLPYFSFGGLYFSRYGNNIYVSLSGLYYRPYRSRYKPVASINRSLLPKLITLGEVKKAKWLKAQQNAPNLFEAPPIEQPSLEAPEIKIENSKEI